jgi:hypothetical protein
VRFQNTQPSSPAQNEGKSGNPGTPCCCWDWDWDLFCWHRRNCVAFLGCSVPSCFSVPHNSSSDALVGSIVFVMKNFEEASRERSLSVGKGYVVILPASLLLVIRFPPRSEISAIIDTQSVRTYVRRPIITVSFGMATLQVYVLIPQYMTSSILHCFCQQQSTTTNIIRAQSTMPSPRRQVCLFGTSANPPTGDGGHTGIVKALSKLDSFHEIRILPVFRHTFASKRNQLESFHHRYNMCKISFGSIDKAAVSDAERKSFQRMAKSL